MEENTLFYSKYCTHCKNFIIQLKKNDLLKLFTKKICIDDPHVKRNLPPFLKEVPTIITSDYDKPIASDMAFKWISFKVKNNKPKQQIQGQNQENKPGQCSGDDLQCFSFDNSYDQYGSLDNGSAYSGKADTNMLQKGGKGSTGSIDYDSFKLINAEQAGQKGSTGSIDWDSFSLTAAATANGGDQNSAASGDFDKRLEKMQQMRALDNNFFGDGDKIRS